VALPDYWMRRPSDVLEAAARVRFDAVLDEVLAHPDSVSGLCREIDPECCRPVWQFLCHAADHHRIAMHGSGNPHIDVFEPRQPHDLTEFGSQRAVYAASDAIWAMFFAIVDRARVESIGNACVTVIDGSGDADGPLYVFAISDAALPTEPWRVGTVFLLPRASFRQQPSTRIGDTHVQMAQLASTEPVRPLAKITVAPDDFPFLHQIRGLDDDRLQEYATAMFSGAPWPDPTAPGGMSRAVS
jgi:hypothetical protein